MTGSGRGGPRAPDAGEEPAPFESPGAPPSADSSAGRLSRAPPASAERFPHARHAKLACLVCHETGTGRGRLTFERPRGCAICHHQAATSARCASCHRTGTFAAPTQATMTVTVAGHPPAPRPVSFLHASHTTRACVECHTAPVTLALAPAKAQCRACHSEHHAAGRTCTACHAIDDPQRGHRTLEAAHQGCDACHTATTIARLTPTRSLCSTCHTAKARNHFDQQECSVCHFLAEPAAFRAKLVTSPPR